MHELGQENVNYLKQSIYSASHTCRNFLFVGYDARGDKINGHEGNAELNVLSGLQSLLLIQIRKSGIEIVRPIL